MRQVNSAHVRLGVKWRQVQILGLFPLGASWGAGGLVVAGGVGDEVFAGGGVDDSDVEVLDEYQDADASVGSADADVV